MQRNSFGMIVVLMKRMYSAVKMRCVEVWKTHLILAKTHHDILARIQPQQHPIGFPRPPHVFALRALCESLLKQEFVIFLGGGKDRERERELNHRNIFIPFINVFSFARYLLRLKRDSRFYNEFSGFFT